MWKGTKLVDAGDIDVLDGNLGSVDAYQRPLSDDDISVPGVPRQTPERIRNVVPCIVDIEHDRSKNYPSSSLFTVFKVHTPFRTEIGCHFFSKVSSPIGVG